MHMVNSCLWPPPTHTPSPALPAGKEIAEVRVVVCGCGAAGFTCAKYFVSLGVKKENLLAVDVQGVVYAGRSDLTPDNYLTEVAVDTPKRTLAEAVDGSDVFLGLSVSMSTPMLWPCWLVVGSQNEWGAFCQLNIPGRMGVIHLLIG
jgi:hypothetical protein